MKEAKNVFSGNLMLLASIVKGITGVVGASLILSEDHPYMALISLAVGAGVNEYLLNAEKNKNKEV
tara:strand:- start:5526 stop:5723 length:198 start_codon:yes stop_codon:yes gene_type:complete